MTRLDDAALLFLFVLARTLVTSHNSSFVYTDATMMENSDNSNSPDPKDKNEPVVEEEKKEDKTGEDNHASPSSTPADGKEAATHTTTSHHSPIPAICVAQGLQQKESALKLESWVALSLTLDGRDKITKVFQYTARFLAWWLAGHPQAKRFEALKVSLTTSRKAFRLLRSLIEYHKLRTMGLLQTLGWHLQQTIHPLSIDQDSECKSPPPPPHPVLRHRASSNIGWGPTTVLSFTDTSTDRRRQSFYRSLSGVAYRFAYRPLISRLSSRLVGSSSAEQAPPLWSVVGAALKIVGLMGFWASDNISFLTGAGLLDDFSLDNKSRLVARQRIQTVASQTGNRFYFFGAIAGLVVNFKCYREFRNGTLRERQEELDEVGEDDVFHSEEDRKAVLKSLEKAKEKEFVLFLALLKSCCDVLVFSNNPGIDLWTRYSGKKLNEGIHCVGGLLSASTVIYNNFPNKKVGG